VLLLNKIHIIGNNKVVKHIYIMTILAIYKHVWS